MLTLTLQKTMESLTRVLAKQVYNIDVKDLPLQRQSEQKEKKLRGMRPNGGMLTCYFVLPWHRFFLFLM